MKNKSMGTYVSGDKRYDEKGGRTGAWESRGRGCSLNREVRLSGPEKVAGEQRPEGAVLGVSEGKACQAEGTVSTQALVLGGWAQRRDIIWLCKDYPGCCVETRLQGAKVEQADRRPLGPTGGQGR